MQERKHEPVELTDKQLAFNALVGLLGVSEAVLFCLKAGRPVPEKTLRDTCLNTRNMIKECFGVEIPEAPEEMAKELIKKMSEGMSDEELDKLQETMVRDCMKDFIGKMARNN